MNEPYYQDEWVTLYHGDCLELTEWLAADVLVTDPPYGIDLKVRKGSYSTSATYKQISSAIANDATPEVRDRALELWGKRPSIVFGSWKIARPATTRQVLIWHKKGQAPGPLNAPFMTQHEEIYVSGDGFRASSPPLMSVIATNEARSNEVQKIGHPTPKPIGLMEMLIDRCPDGVIAEPFAGSGATLLAARNLGRKVIGVELDESYCELIAKRLGQATFDFSGLGVSA